jgi:hypothetical protein
MFLMVSAVLILGLLKSLPCMAQAEIVPDHFDYLTAEEAAAGSHLGSFTLLHQVSYAGQTLPAGAYLLSVQPSGGGNLVTLTPEGTAASVQVIRIKCQPAFDHPTALILERSGEQYVLTAIRFEQPGEPLKHLQLQGAPSRPVSPDSERVQVAYKNRTGSAK